MWRQNNLKRNERRESENSTVKKSELLQELKRNVTEHEWELLRSGSTELIIGEFNRRKMLELADGGAGDEEVSAETLAQLHRTLQAYLDQYMADRPQGHKWIILVSIYQAFVRGEPMHPEELVGIRRTEKNGRIVYECPAMEIGENSVCGFCVCSRDRG